MALLINNISVNQAQVSEIYDSALNARKLGEAMSLPSYVIDEVRRQIRDEGLRYLKPDTNINKTVPFTINHAKNDARQSLKAVKADSKPVFTDKTPPAKREQTMQRDLSKRTLTGSILVLLATSKTIMQPQELNATLKVDSVKLSQSLKDLVDATLIIRTDNGRYTLSKNGEEKVANDWPSTSIHPSVYKRIERYTSKAVAKSSTAKPSAPAITKSDSEVNEMTNYLLTEDNSDSSELDQIEIELAKLDCGSLKAVDVKVKILHTLSNKFGGRVGAHLTELQHFISR